MGTNGGTITYSPRGVRAPRLYPPPGSAFSLEAAFPPEMSEVRMFHATVDGIYLSPSCVATQTSVASLLRIPRHLLLTRDFISCFGDRVRKVCVTDRALILVWQKLKK